MNFAVCNKCKKGYDADRERCHCEVSFPAALLKRRSLAVLMLLWVVVVTPMVFVMGGIFAVIEGWKEEIIDFKRDWRGGRESL